MHKLQTVIDQLRDDSQPLTRSFAHFAADLIEAEMESLETRTKQIIAALVNTSPAPEEVEREP